MKKTLFLLSLLMFTPAALADVPGGYTQVTITDVSQLGEYAETDYTAFIIAADVTDSTYRMTGAHQYWTDETLQTNNLTFTGLQDGALRVGGEVTLEKLNKLDFTRNGGENKSSSAITVANGVLTITGNKSVSLLYNFNNTPDCSGGAVSVFPQGVMTFSHNDAVLFEGNHSTVPMKSDGVGTQGGAIYGKGELNVTDNGSVTFSESEAFRGGAISTQGTMLMTGNRSLTFRDNKTPYEYRENTQGGAMYVTGTSRHEITGNKRVEFSGNSAGDFGGAIFIETGSNFTLSNNESIEFNGNSISNPASSGCGGAIYSTGTLNITGNGSVVFRENDAEKGGAIYMEAGTLNLAAGEGQLISFYDTLYVFSSDTTVSFNARYTDASGETKDATGDIVFTGADGEAPTSVVNTVTNLYGGRLRVEDGAVYQGNGIAVAEGSNATVRLAGGSLQHSGANITLAAGTTLEMQGVNNSISAKTLDMQAGSTLSFVLESGNLNQAALNLNGAFNQGGTLNIVLQAGETYQADERLILMTMASGQAPDSWVASKITLSGSAANAGRLEWEDGTLLFRSTLPELVTATWTGGQSRLWNNQDRNWVQGEYGYRNTDGADVKFTDTASGEVTLAGELAPKSVLVDNSAGHDYTFKGEGRIVGTATLTKEGEGTLTINTANTFTGGTLLKLGTLVMGKDSALGSGDVTLAGGTLDLNTCTLDNKVSVTGDATLGHGILNETVTVGAGKNLTLLGSTTIAGGISLGEGASADLGDNRIAGTISLAGSATVGNGYLYSALSVAEGKTLTLGDNLEGSGKIILADGAALDMNHYTLSNQVVLNGSATLGPGEIGGNLTVQENKTLTLTGSLEGSGTIHLGNNTTLDMGGAGTSLAINVAGNATLSNGALDKAVTVCAGAALTLDEKVTSFSGTKFTLEDGATANLKGNKIAGDFTLNGSAALTSGTLEVKSLDPAAQGLLQDMTVTPGLIEGFGRPTSLADGLEIQSQADLMIKGMTITANNSISVGNHAITLNQVTIQLTQAEYTLVGSDYYFNLRSLINCELKMVDVTFDATGLTLGSAMEKVVFDFGEEVNIDSATRMRLLLDEEWASRASVAGGILVFSKSAPIPEPTTGTLSLLALVALAARRRRK